jgi:hypothetical protein
MKRTVLSLVLLLVLGASLTACGSSKKTVGATTSTTSSFQAAYQAYRTCMAQNGVNLPANMFNRGQRPNGGNGGSGASAPAGSANNTASTGNGGPRSGGTPPSTTLPAGVTEQQYQKAQQACQSKMPQRQSRDGAGGTTQFAAYLSCLKDHGVNVDTNGGAQALANIDRTTATFQAAQTACSPLLPKRNSSTTSTTTAV